MPGVRHLILLLVIAGTALGAELVPGRVVGVHDGDTLTLLTAEKKSIRVRLYGIDAPETKQPFGSRAKEALSGLVFGKDVRIEVVDKDRYGRTVGRVSLGNTNVNEEMVRRGFVWWYRDFAKRDKTLKSAESEAMAAKRGLWSEPNPIAPWQWRRNEAAERKAAK